MPEDQTAVLSVLAPPSLLTVQDLGRSGHRALGLPAGGAMDPWALRAANTLVGNAEGSAALEWATGGGLLRLEGRSALIALTGADAEATVDGAPLPLDRSIRVPAGARLRIQGLRRGQFLYLAVAGGVDVPVVLGGRGSYLPAGLGGVAGRSLRGGDLVPLGAEPANLPTTGVILPGDLRDPLPPPQGSVRVMAGPHGELLDTEGWERLLGTTFTVAVTADRTGYRLSGPPVVTGRLASLPSEPTCPGALQLPPGGQPIVLMADGPTVGGYPTPAVVCAADLGRLAQCAPGTTVRFVLIDVPEAQRLYRRRRVAIDTLDRIIRGPTSPTYSSSAEQMR